MDSDAMDRRFYANAERNETRDKALATRRAKYGPKGHARSYNCPWDWQHEKAALDWICELHENGVLSEGQCSKRLNMERVAFRIMMDDWRIKNGR